MRSLFRLLPQLVAIAGADGDLVATLGAAATENRRSGLGLHAAQKAMGLGAATTVGLKGTLRHGTKLLERQEASCRIFFVIAAITDCTVSDGIFTGAVLVGWSVEEKQIAPLPLRLLRVGSG